jgi:hypothetical protein
MKLTHTKAAVVALIAAAGLLPAFTSSVQAQPLPTNSTTQFQRAQQALEHKIIARQVQLALLGAEVADAANVTAADRSALVTIITNEQSALGTDATNVAAATTDAQLSTVRQAVVGDERVYAVVTGQVGLVMAADNDTVSEAGYTALTIELTPLVTELGSTYATTLLSDVTSEMTAATALTAGVSADALALTPAGYPGNESQIKSYSVNLRESSKDLGTAKVDIKRIETMALGAHKLPRAHII